MIKDRLNERTLTPQEVRTILKADNKEIVDLCKKAAIRPRKMLWVTHIFLMMK